LKFQHPFLRDGGIVSSEGHQADVDKSGVVVDPHPSLIQEHGLRVVEETPAQRKAREEAEAKAKAEAEAAKK